jgi:hypothetical protein
MKEAACRTDLGPLTKKLLEQQHVIERLRAESQNAYERTKTLTAERDALFVLTDRLTAERDALRAQRDEARRLCCERAAMDESGYVKHGTMLHFAESRGWDCFKEKAP